MGGHGFWWGLCGVVAAWGMVLWAAARGDTIPAKVRVWTIGQVDEVGVEEVRDDEIIGWMRTGRDGGKEYWCVECGRKAGRRARRSWDAVPVRWGEREKLRGWGCCGKEQEGGCEVEW